MKILQIYLIFSFITCLTFTVYADEKNKTSIPLIEVSTSATAKSLPDQAEMSITFTSLNLNAEKARKDVDKQIKPFLAALKDYEIHKNSLDSSQTELHPEYDYSNRQKVFLGYRFTRYVRLKLDELSQLEDLIKQITDNGASTLGSLNFTLQKPDKLKRKALNKAIARAKAKAKAIAEGFGVNLGAIHKVSHTDTPMRPGTGMRMMAMNAELAGDSGKSTSYHQKEIEFSSSVNVSYLID